MPPTDRPLVAGRGRADVVLTVIACLTVLVVPLVPGVLRAGDANALLGIPAESVVVLLVLLAVARPTVRGIAAAVFAVLAVGAILIALLDLGFRATIDRPFSPVEDGGALIDAFGVMRSALGPVSAAGVLLLIAALVVTLTAAVAFAALRIGSVARAAGPRGRAAVAVVAGAWIVCSLTGAEVVPGAPVAASTAGDTLVDTSARAAAGVQKQQVFERALANDPLEQTDPALLMTALAGKDVIIAFVESYGRVAVEPAPFTGGIERVLADGAASLERRGYAARSAFLTSPTFGGVSWLAHATLQSGLWVDSPITYDRLLGEDRTTLTSAFAAAGWRTMAVVPSNERDWPAGQAFYGFDSILDSRDMGYRGPAFGYARMPDQYTWKVFHDRADLDGTQPVMAEIDLVSSHTPWTPLPRMLPWTELGDGSVFAAQAANSESPVTGWTDAQRARELYAESVEYSLSAVFSYVETFGGDDLVLVVLGDHQPARIVSGPDAGHDVPVTIIAKDPAVFDAIRPWQWEDGVRPTATAPVWRMDEFRDRFVDAFSG
jgi:hypothetical protein